MNLIYIFLLIVIVICILGIIYIYHFNKLQRSKTKIDSAEYLIDEALRKKYDTLVNIDKVIMKELDTKSLFKDLDKLKNQDISNFDFDRKLIEYFNLLNQIIADNKELEDNKALKNALKDNNETEEKLQAAKAFYNKYTSSLNDLVRVFPSNIIARIHGIKIKTYFDGKNLEDDIVDDFKL